MSLLSGAKLTRNKLYTYTIALGILIAVLLPVLGLEPTYVQLLVIVGINTILGLSITMLLGFTGEISLGNAGFFAIGAYSSALLVLKLHLPIWVSIPLAIALCGLFGLLLSFPAGRVKEFYLAILTLGFGMIIQVVIKQWDLTGAYSGLTGIPSTSLNNLVLFGQKVTITGYYYLVMAVLLLIFWVFNNLLKSYVGRSMVSVSTSQIAAASIGINAGRVRQLAYTISGCLAGLGGTLYAHLVGYLGYDAFGLMASVNMLVISIVGGLHTLVGALLGSMFLTIIPHKLQVFQEWQLILYGLLLWGVAVLFPSGIAGILKIRTGYVRKKPAPKSTQLSEPTLPTEVSKVAGGPLLVLEQVSKHFGGVTALNKVSMQINRGTIHGLIGPNGSGKSTLVNVVSGVYKLDGGTVSFDGEAVSNLPAYKLSRKGIVRTFQNPQVFKGMTVEENAVAGAYQRFNRGIIRCMFQTKSARKEEAGILSQTQDLLEKVRLSAMSEAIANELPYGNQRLVEVVRAANANPKLLILDEPAAGLSETELEHLGAIIRMLKEHGVTILLIEHHVEFLMGLADHVTVLDYGEEIFDGLPKQCTQDPRVIEAYLGGQRYAKAQ